MCESGKMGLTSTGLLIRVLGVGADLSADLAGNHLQDGKGDRSCALLEGLCCKGPASREGGLLQGWVARLPGGQQNFQASCPRNSSTAWPHG